VVIPLPVLVEIPAKILGVELRSLSFCFRNYPTLPVILGRILIEGLDANIAGIRGQQSAQGSGLATEHPPYHSVSVGRRGHGLVQRDCIVHFGAAVAISDNTTNVAGIRGDITG